MKITNVMAASLDGRIASQRLESDDERQKSNLSSPADRAFLLNEIEKAEAVIVGAGSIRSNGVCLSHPGKNEQFPAWYVLSQSPLPYDLSFWNQKHIPRYLVSAKPLPIKDGSGVKNLVYSDRDPAEFIIDALSQAQLSEVLLFGGGIVNKMFYQKNLVDSLKLTISPLFIGKEDAPYLIFPDLENAVEMSLLSSRNVDNYVFLEYQVKRK